MPMPEAADATLLASPAAQIAARARAEDTLAPVMRDAIAQFLDEVQRLALADPRGYPAADPMSLVAADVPRGERDPLTAAQLEAAWVVGADAMITAVMSLLAAQGVPQPVRDNFEARLRRRLLNDVTPDQAMAAANAALAAAASRGWSRAQTVQSLTLHLTMDVPDGAWPTGLKLEDTIPAYDWLADAGRLSRTEATAAHGLAVDSALAEQGFTRKRWMARKDRRTRDSHAAADGQTVPLGQPFVVGGVPLDYPGDPAGPAEEVFNCRCVEVGVRPRPGTPNMDPQAPAPRALPPAPAPALPPAPAPALLEG